LRRAIRSPDYAKQVSGGSGSTRVGSSGGRVRGTGVWAEPESHLPRRSQLQHDYGRVGDRDGDVRIEYVDQYVRFVVDVERDRDGDGQRQRDRDGDRAGAGVGYRWIGDPDSDPDGHRQGQAGLWAEGEKGTQAAPGDPPADWAAALRGVIPVDAYDRDGEPISFKRWHELMFDFDYRRLAATTVESDNVARR
jgi:hypothetical protein